MYNNENGFDELAYDRLYKDTLNDADLMLRYLYTESKLKDTLKKEKKTIKKAIKKYNEEGLYGILDK